jgi:NADH-quinone oxidoreductase subunit M
MTSGWPPLSSVIAIPLLAGVVCCGPWFARERDTQSRLCRVWALLAAVGTLVVLLAIGGAGVASPGQMLRVEEVRPWIPSWGISFHLTLDGLSFVFCLLTAVITLAILAWSSKPVSAGAGWYAALLLGESAVMGAFLATDLVLFYVFYELMLLPVLAAIALWGGPLRMQAAVKFLLYTMLGSVLMFVAILYLGWRGMGILQAHAGAAPFAFEITALSTLPRMELTEQILLGLCFLVAFGVKIPAVPLHGWLADTYREAPHGIAAFTAALLGKVGLYGLVRFVWPLFPDCMELLAPAIAAIGAIGVVYGAMIALVQRDIRSLLAFSSLSHLGFCILGVAAASELAISGAVFQSVSHGLVTAALFLVFGAIIDREGVSDFESLGGLASKIPVTAFFLMVFSLAAVALPLTSSFVGEFLIIIGSWQKFPQWTSLALLGVVLGAVYTLTAYLKTMFGAARDTLPMRRADLHGGEIIVMGALAVLVMWLGIFPGRVLSLVEQPVALQLEQIANTGRAAPRGRVFSDDQKSAPSESGKAVASPAIAARYDAGMEVDSPRSRGEVL